MNAADGGSGLADRSGNAAMRLQRVWDLFLDHMHGFAVAWISTLSVIAGGLLFLTPQAQDLFLEVRGGIVSGTLFWTAFYAAVLLAWVLPVYFSARWILWQSRPGQLSHTAANPVKDNARRLVPPLLAFGCFAALVLGQVLSLLNVPDLVNLTAIEDELASLRTQTPIACGKFTLVGALNANCALSVSRLLGLGATWEIFTEWKLGAEWMIISLYLFAFGLCLWLLAGLAIHRNLAGYCRLVLKVLWWSLSIIGLPIALVTAMLFFGSLWEEAQKPYTLVHMAALPAVSAVLGYVLWILLRPRKAGRATMFAEQILANDNVAVSETQSFNRLIRPLFYILLAAAAVLTVLLVAIHPVDVTSYVYRVMLVPFLLGPLVAPMTYVSHWSVRCRAPLVIGVICLIGLFSILAGETHAVRTLPLPDATPRYSLNSSVGHWAKANGCELTRPQSCPSPIIIAAAGGASRAGFFVGGVIGKLIDERLDAPRAVPGAPLSQGPIRVRLRRFDRQLFAISSVSGGSLGAVMAFAALADAQLAQGSAVGADAAASPTIANPTIAPPASGASMLPAGPPPPPCEQQRAAADRHWFRSGIAALPLADQPHLSWRSCLQMLLAGDYLSPVFVRMVGADLIGIGTDRAVTLEQAWERRYQAITGRDTLNAPLTAVRHKVVQRGGWLPVLLLNGTSVETGRRIVTSDIDTLHSSTQPRDGTVQYRRRANRLFVDAFDLHELQSGRAPAKLDDRAGRRQQPLGQFTPKRDLRLSTAATMSARFPVVSPHGSIKDADGRISDRVVDGGYFENYGATTALELAGELRSLGLKPTVILINNDPASAQMDCIGGGQQVTRPARPEQQTWFSTLTSPLAAVIGTRGARGTYSAVALCSFVEGVRGTANNGSFAYINVKPSSDKPLSMSWWLSKHVQQYLDLHLGQALQTETLSSQQKEFAGINGSAMAMIRDWRRLKQPGQSAAGPVPQRAR